MVDEGDDPAGVRHGIVARRAREDGSIVAVAAVYEVVALAAGEGVVTGVTVDQVVDDRADDGVGAVRAVEADGVARRAVLVDDARLPATEHRIGARADVLAGIAGAGAGVDHVAPDGGRRAGRHAVGVRR